MTAHTLGRALRDHLRRRAEFYWAPLLYCLAVYLLYREVFAGERGFGWDTIESYWPDLVYLSDELRAGHWPLWNPYDRGGYPYAADPQPGLYYPIQWLCALLGMLVDTSWWLIEFKLLLHQVIAALCMHAFLRYRGLPKVAALVGGLAWIASTPWLIHKASNLLMPMVWVPLLWLATDYLLKRPCFSRAAFLAFAIYLAGSAGSPPGFFYALIMAGLYGVFRSGEALLARRATREMVPYAGKLALAIAGAAFLAFALLWVGVAPALELSEHTPRQARDLGYALSLPLNLWPTLRSLLVPTAGQVDAYCGILVMLLALCAVTLRPTRDRGAPVFFAIAALFFLALSVGGQLPILEFLVTHVPGFGLFRISSRYKCAFAPMVAVLAAYGASNLLAMRPRPSAETWRLLILAAVSAAVVIYLLRAHPLDPQLIKRFPSWKTPLLLSTLAIAMLIATGLRRHRAATILVAAMPLLMLGDTPRYWHHQQLFLEAKVDHHEDLQIVDSLVGVRDLQVRIYDEFVLGQRPGSRLQIRDFRGYPSGDPLDFQRYRDVLSKASAHPELLEAFNVRYILHGRHHRSGSGSQRLKIDPATKSPNHFVRGAGPVREALHPVPLVAWYGAIASVPGNKVLDAMLAAEDDSGERRYAIVEPAVELEEDTRAMLEARRANAPSSIAGTLHSFESDRVVVDIDAPDAGLVVLNEVNYQGWTVTIDGVPGTNLTANYLLRAVVVDAGQHRIEWRYQPPGQKQRSILYLFALLALMAALAHTLGLSTKLRRLTTSRYYPAGAPIGSDEDS